MFCTGNGHRVFENNFKTKSVKHILRLDITIINKYYT